MLIVCDFCGQEIPDWKDPDPDEPEHFCDCHCKELEQARDEAPPKEKTDD